MVVVDEGCMIRSCLWQSKVWQVCGCGVCFPDIKDFHISQMRRRIKSTCDEDSVAVDGNTRMTTLTFRFGKCGGVGGPGRGGGWVVGITGIAAVAVGVFRHLLLYATLLEYSTAVQQIIGAFICKFEMTRDLTVVCCYVVFFF